MALNLGDVAIEDVAAAMLGVGRKKSLARANRDLRWCHNLKLQFDIGQRGPICGSRHDVLLFWFILRKGSREKWISGVPAAATTKKWHPEEFDLPH